MPFLVDSNVLIDISRGNEAAIKYVDALTQPWVISQVTALELISGTESENRSWKRNT
jgi:predicted nucleic acid-binding protein